jgi:hypothetical protein
MKKGMYRAIRYEKKLEEIMQLNEFQRAEENKMLGYRE